MTDSNTSFAKPKPTQKDIADASGFAVTTVSRALAGDPLIARKTRDKIALVAEKFGYVPDRAAQRLRTGRTNVIALVLDPHGEILDFAGSMISGCAEIIRGTRYHLNLVQYQQDEDPLTPIKNIVRNRLADGVVFARTEARDPRVAYLLQADFPFVTHGRTDLGPHAWHDYDNTAFAALAVERLAQKNRKRLLLIPPAPQYSFAKHMMQGFQMALDKHGVEGIIPDGFNLNSTVDQMYESISRHLKDPNPPDGIICPGEIAAMTALAAVDDHGFSLGREIDLLAKQTSRVFDMHRPRIETIYEDIEEAGRSVARALLDQIEGAPMAKLQTLQAPEIRG